MQETGSRPSRPGYGKLGLAAFMLWALAGCDATGGFGLLPAQDDGAAVATDTTRTGLIERDIEAPEVFQVTEAGLWDGRPSLDGVWVAHPDTKDPERVLIRNTANGKFVIGALFRRERELPGPRLQVSSDAAAALGMLAGAPTQIQVTALRREEVAAPAAPAVTASTPGATTLPAAPGVTAAPLDPVAGIAAGAIAAAEIAPKPAPGPAPSADPRTTRSTPPVAPPAAAAGRATPAAPVVAPAARTGSGLEKPWLQVGIFSVEANAKSTAAALKSAGMLPVVRQQESKGKPFWRVMVGPANTLAERDILLKQIKASGFTDAYAVTN